MRTGIGYDVHILKKGQKLVLGGVQVPFEKGLEGHSDADAASHALGDALLGAAGMGDIGIHFPDSDVQYKNMSSIEILEIIKNKLKEKNYEVNNVDITIICEKPFLSPYLGRMCSNIAGALDIPGYDVNVKATTAEGTGPAGRGEAISAMAVATVIPSPKYSK